MAPCLSCASAESSFAWCLRRPSAARRSRRRLQYLCGLGVRELYVGGALADSASLTACFAASSLATATAFACLAASRPRSRHRVRTGRRSRRIRHRPRPAASRRGTPGHHSARSVSLLQRTAPARARTRTGTAPLVRQRGLPSGVRDLLVCRIVLRTAGACLRCGEVGFRLLVGGAGCCGLRILPASLFCLAATRTASAESFADWVTTSLDWASASVALALARLACALSTAPGRRARPVRRH